MGEWVGSWWGGGHLFGVDLVVGGGWAPRGDDVVGWVSGWVSGWVHGGVGVMAPLEKQRCGGGMFSDGLFSKLLAEI